ncbi:MAG: PP2C family serine/threonine-protein phosphatase [Gemmataceae bacterium]
MPVNIQCPHCGSLCQISEQHFGTMVNCGRCRQPFTVRSAPPPQEQKAGGLKGMFRALMPFSKMEGQSIPQSPAPASSATAAAPPAPMAEQIEDDDFDFGDVDALLNRPDPNAAPPPAPAPAPAARAAAPAPAGNWSPPQPAASGVFRLDIGASTSVGQVRNRNEDSYAIQYLSWSSLERRQELALIVVADGMGGHGAGDKASHIIVHAVVNSLSRLLGGIVGGQVKDTSPATLNGAIVGAIKAANKECHQKAQTESGARGMGATLEVVIIYNGQLVAGHVGDTRIYCCRSGKLSQLTQDQTLVAKMVAAGQLTPQQALNHPAKNEVAQAVGRQPDVEPASYQLKLSLGDWLVVACDGLHAHIDGPKLEGIIRGAQPSGAFLAHHLVDQANNAGGSDNITVVACRCY